MTFPFGEGLGWGFFLTFNSEYNTKINTSIITLSFLFFFNAGLFFCIKPGKPN